MCSCVLFLVRFSRVFCRAFSGVFWRFCWWYFLCFSWCFFHCVLVLFSVLFFVLVPFLFYIRFPLVVVLFFAVLFFVVFGCFFRAFFRAFCGVFFVSFIVLFFVHFFVLFLVFFRVVFFRALGGTRDKRPQYFAFWPVLFSVLFLVVTTSEDRIYTIYMYINASRGQSPDHLIKLNKGNRFNNKKSEKLKHFSFSVFNIFFWSNSMNYQNLMRQKAKVRPFQ